VASLVAAIVFNRLRYQKN